MSMVGNAMDPLIQYLLSLQQPRNDTSLDAGGVPQHQRGVPNPYDIPGDPMQGNGPPQTLHEMRIGGGMGNPLAGPQVERLLQTLQEHLNNHPQPQMLHQYLTQMVSAMKPAIHTPTPVVGGGRPVA